MNDRELLELAAKAGGIASGDVFYDMERDKEWNPLTDDGDALRLAVRLDIEIDNTGEFASCLYWYDRTACELGETKEPNGNDKYAATRRSIVRAAAEIGKAMEG